MRRIFLLLFIIAVSAICADVFHRRADVARSTENRDHVFIPSAEAFKVAAMGYDLVLADLYWVRAVLAFSDLYSKKTDKEVTWLNAMLKTVARLDPKWRTVYFYGGSMLRVIEAIDESDALFEKGMQSLPNDPYFPFSIGMNAYMYRQDYERAAEYLNIAAQKPGAPAWYRGAAAGILSRGGQRQTAIRYLKQQYDETSSPEIRSSIERKLTRLLHDEYAAQLEELRAAFLVQFGRDIRTVSELVEMSSVIETLPPEPHGTTWIIAPDGKIRGEAEEKRLVDGAVYDERRMLMNRDLFDE